jgi:Tol biopolymer transport system component
MSQSPYPSLPLAFLGFFAAFVALSGACPAAEPTYWQDIRPILRKNCTVCHSAKNVKEVDVSGGLALDTYEAIRKGSKGPVIQAGKSGASLLIERLQTDDDDKRMPQGSSPLLPETIALIRRWIDSGAKEGSRPDNTPTTVAVSSARRTRKLEIILNTDAVPPKGLFGTANPATLALSLPVGPLAPVAAVRFSPDGKLLVTGSYGRVTIWDLASARPVKLLTNVLGTVNDLRFSPDGSLLAVTGGQPSAKGDLRLYQVADWKLLATLPGHADVVFCVAFSPDGKRLASASFDKTVRVWDVPGRKLERVLTGHSDFVYSIAFSPDGQWLASASKDRTVKVVDLATGKSRFTFSGMDQDVLAVAVSPDGKQVVSSGFESALYWWNPQTGERIRLQGGHGNAVHELCFSRDGQLLVSAGADRTVRLWHGVTGAPLRVLPVNSLVYASAVSSDGKRIASGSFDGLVRLWDAASGRHLLTLLSMPPEGDDFDWLALTPEGYAAGSSGIVTLGQWRMAGRVVPANNVWKTLRQPDAVAKALRGEKLAVPVLGK